MKKKRLVIGNKRTIQKHQDVTLNVQALENQIANLTAQVTQLAQIVHKQNIEFKAFKFQRPPVENIRVVHQKPIETEDERILSDFDKLIKATQREVSKHLDSLSGLELQDVIQSAITGQPISERTEVKHPTGGTDGAMASWLNANIPTVNTQENIWDSIERSQVIARERNAARAIEAKEFTKDWVASMKDSKAIRDAYKLADEDTCKTEVTDAGLQ